LIIFSDIFGANSSRHFSVADTYASFGYNVYLPELLVKPYALEVIDMDKIMKVIA
jgi:dienelactone hydrolase